MDIEEIVKRLEDGLIVADRIQERHSAALESHKQWLEDLTRVGMEHQRLVALSVAQELFHRHPADAASRSALLRSYEKVGDIQGSGAQAISDYQRSGRAHV